MSTSGGDRDTLFGLIAVHNGLLTREQLGAGPGWRGALAEEDRRLIDALVERHARLPEEARRTLEALWHRGEGATPTVSRATLAGGLVPPAREAPAVGAPRFRRLKLHARGGLGEVYLAFDEELGREVALKEIQPRHAGDADARGRFVREAEITGKLEHPGIVPVYGLGSPEGGQPSYAMRFIRGESL